ncbi:hypothetical protein L227DRAFT_658203 [Lentinus tigrinus ALCF2SS1-6]|uniref:Uncharacterized protein n=1 Tax=Lentinus tigrinus ALCF2SS1-6 TaxID=1328759 RepID=A0A5C2RQJ9_9APHY|nr:hypothetical protein L227DRAFT_658203 [Lentinus tigrinus ALCF2SS1-6]
MHPSCVEYKSRLVCRTRLPGTSRYSLPGRESYRSPADLDKAALLGPPSCNSRTLPAEHHLATSVSLPASPYPPRLHACKILRAGISSCSDNRSMPGIRDSHGWYQSRVRAKPRCVGDEDNDEDEDVVLDATVALTLQAEDRARVQRTELGSGLQPVQWNTGRQDFGDQGSRAKETGCNCFEHWQLRESPCFCLVLESAPNRLRMPSVWEIMKELLGRKDRINLTSSAWGDSFIINLGLSTLSHPPCPLVST